MTKKKSFKTLTSEDGAHEDLVSTSQQHFFIVIDAASK
jgi:hypothetical protein